MIRRRDVLIGSSAALVAALFAHVLPACVVPALQVEQTFRYRLRVPFDEYRRRLAQRLGGQAEIAELSPTRFRVRDPNEANGAIEFQEREGMLVARSLFSEAASDDARNRYRRLLRRATTVPELGPRVDAEGREATDENATASRGLAVADAGPAEPPPTTQPPPPRAPPRRPGRPRVR